MDYPSFFKKDNHWFKVINEKQYIEVLTLVSITGIKCIQSRFDEPKAIPISKENFDKAYANATNKINHFSNQ